MNAEQCLAKSEVMSEEQINQPQVSPATVSQQQLSQVPVLLQGPTAFVPVNCTPVTLIPQVISYSLVPGQPVTVPCLFPNVILQPCINIALPVLPAQVLVSNISFQGPPDNANQSPVISTEIPDASNNGPEVHTQLPNTSNLAPEVCAETPDISNHGTLPFEVDRQRVLDAAEALLILHNSTQASPETCNTPGPDGE